MLTKIKGKKKHNLFKLQRRSAWPHWKSLFLVIIDTLSLYLWQNNRTLMFNLWPGFILYLTPQLTDKVCKCETSSLPALDVIFTSIRIFVKAHSPQARLGNSSSLGRGDCECANLLKFSLNFAETAVSHFKQALKLVRTIWGLKKI